MLPITGNHTKQEREEIESLKGLCKEAEREWENQPKFCSIMQKINALEIINKLEYPESEELKDLSERVRSLQEGFQNIFRLTTRFPKEFVYKIFELLPARARWPFQCLSPECSLLSQEFAKTEVFFGCEAIKDGLKFLIEKSYDAQFEKLGSKRGAIERLIKSLSDIKTLSELRSIEIEIKEACADLLKDLDPKTWEFFKGQVSKETSPKFVQSLLTLTDIFIQLESADKDESFSTLIESLIEEGHFDKAEALVPKIQDVLKRSLLLGALAVKRAERGEFRKAREIAAKNPDPDILSNTQTRINQELQTTAIELAEQERIEEAIELSRLINDEKMKSKTLKEIIDVFLEQFTYYGNFYGRITEGQKKIIKDHSNSDIQTLIQNQVACLAALGEASKAIDLAQLIVDRGIRLRTSQEILIELAKKGDLCEAIKLEPVQKFIEKLIRLWIKGGDFNNLRQTIQILPESYRKQILHEGQIKKIMKLLSMHSEKGCFFKEIIEVIQLFPKEDQLEAQKLIIKNIISLEWNEAIEAASKLPDDYQTEELWSAITKKLLNYTTNTSAYGFFWGLGSICKLPPNYQTETLWLAMTKKFVKKAAEWYFKDIIEAIEGPAAIKSPSNKAQALNAISENLIASVKKGHLSNGDARVKAEFLPDPYRLEVLAQLAQLKRNETDPQEDGA